MCQRHGVEVGLSPELVRAGQGDIDDDVLLVSFHDMAAVAGVCVAGGRQEVEVSVGGRRG